MALNTTAGETEAAQHETLAKSRDDSPGGEASRP
jgi:hypothetical protein